MKNKMSIVVAEDNEIYMDGLMLNLNKMPQVQVVAQACNGNELVASY